MKTVSFSRAWRGSSLLRLRELRSGAVALLCLFGLASSSGLYAAEIVRSTSAACDARLQGEINPGDFERLKDQLTEKMRLCLHSPGGSILDGIELFEHIAESRIGTIVEKDGECYSACAVAFMGGADGKYGDRFPDRTIIAGGVVGFHSPYISSRAAIELPPGLNSLPVGYQVGIAVIAKLLRADRHGLWPRSLIAHMLETPPTSLYNLDSFRKIRAANVELKGVPAPAKIDKRMLYQACVNSDPWLEGSTATATAQEARESELAVIDQPPRYRIIFSGFGFQAMDSCAVEIVDRAEGRQMLIKLEYGDLRSVSMEPADERPLWLLYSLERSVVGAGQ